MLSADSMNVDRADRLGECWMLLARPAPNDVAQPNASIDAQATGTTPRVPEQLKLAF